ncbi:hypothetical protein CspHIS471_0302170 [Cutaneotrichosporon sp. HIS471]|nr:hypothetical protein CspHIS471_0302170 [Cutaneotrichosporon sp. HIS471]
MSDMMSTLDSTIPSPEYLAQWATHPSTTSSATTPPAPPVEMDESAPPRPTVIIDASAFPHILEAICSHSSGRDLLAFRQTCKAMKRQADKQLFRHVELVSYRRGDKCFVEVQPFRSNIAFECADRTSQQMGRHDKMEAHKNERRGWAKDRIRESELIDVPHGMVGNSPFVYQFLPTIPVTRRDSGCLLSISMEQRRFDISRRNSRINHQVILLALPPHLFGDPITLYNKVFRDLRGQTTVHFLATSVEPPAITRQGDSILKQLLAVPFAKGNESRLTVVGAARAMRVTLGVPEDASESVFDEALLALLPYKKTRHSPEQMRDRFRKDVCFVSPEQYERQVGAKQVALETRADPFNGPAAVYIE